MRTPDFSNAEIGDTLWVLVGGKWLRGTVTDNDSSRELIYVKFPDVSYIEPFGYDGVNGWDESIIGYWQPLPDPPEECLRRPRSSHGK